MPRLDNFLDPDCRKLPLESVWLVGNHIPLAILSSQRTDICKGCARCALRCNAAGFGCSNRQGAPWCIGVEKQFPIEPSAIQVALIIAE